MKEQKTPPQYCIVVENIKEVQHASQKILDKYFHGTKINPVYISTESLHVGTSRNLGLENCFTDIGIFVDDDVIFPRLLVKTILDLHKNYPKVCCFVGKVLPTNNDALSRFGSWFFCRDMLSEKKMTLMTGYSASTFSYKVQQIKKSKVKFKESWLTGEDIDFFTSLHKKSYNTYFHPSIETKHEFRSSWIKFISRHFQYASCFAKLATVHPKHCSIDRYLPYRKLHWIFLPAFWISDTSNDFNYHFNRKKISKDLKLIFFVNRFVEFIGVYTSREARPFLKSNFRRVWGISHIVN